MPRKSLQLAIEHAASLPQFSSKKEAESMLFKERDILKDRIEYLANNIDLLLDYSPESLKALERWYFDIYDVNDFSRIGISQGEFELCMGVYLGFVYTVNDSEFEWIAYKDSFAHDRYQLAVTKGLYTKRIGPLSHLHKLTNNKRKQSIFRGYAESA